MRWSRNATVLADNAQQRWLLIGGGLVLLGPAARLHPQGPATAQCLGMTVLSVNLNKIALVRNSRRRHTPSVVKAARTVLAAGAAGITVHPRPDQRHIRPGDVQTWRHCCASYPGIEFNIEGNPFAGRDATTAIPASTRSSKPPARIRPRWCPTATISSPPTMAGTCAATPARLREPSPAIRPGAPA
jgi:hypothetical protein